MQPLQNILSDSLQSSRRGFEITFYSQSVRHAPPHGCCGEACRDIYLSWEKNF